MKCTNCKEEIGFYDIDLFLNVVFGKPIQWRHEWIKLPPQITIGNMNFLTIGRIKNNIGCSEPRPDLREYP